jgi:hypothetical protein
MGKGKFKKNDENVEICNSKLFGRSCPEYSVLKMASGDVGDAVGYTGRTRFYQVIPRRLESSDCSDGWEQSWALLRGNNLWAGRSERVHLHP